MKRKKGFTFDAFEVASNVFTFGLKFLLFAAVLYLAWDLGFLCLAYQNCRANMVMHYATMFAYGLGVALTLVLICVAARLASELFVKYLWVRIAITVISALALWFFWGSFGGHWFLWFLRVVAFLFCVGLIIGAIYVPLLFYIRENTYLQLPSIAACIAGVYLGWDVIVSTGLLGWIICFFFVCGTLLLLSGIQPREGPVHGNSRIKEPEPYVETDVDYWQSVNDQGNADDQFLKHYDRVGK